MRAAEATALTLEDLAAVQQQVFARASSLDSANGHDMAGPGHQGGLLAHLWRLLRNRFIRRATSRKRSGKAKTVLLIVVLAVRWQVPSGND